MKEQNRVVAVSVAALAILAVVPVRAQQPAVRGGGAADTVVLTLEEVQRLVLQRNPEFLAERGEAAAARGRLRQSRALFNPELELRSPGSVSGGGGYEAFLAQEVEWGGERGLRVRAAQLDVERTELEVRDAARRALAAATAAYVEAVAAERRLAVVRELAGLSERLLEATRREAAEGEISRLEAQLAGIEAGRARARVLGAEREAVAARLELQRVAGLGPEQPVRVADTVVVLAVPAELDEDALVALALARRPDLAAGGRVVERERALTALASREPIPNLRVGVVGEGGGVGGERTLGLGVDVAVPLWDRNRGAVAEQRARAEQARYARAATELQVRTEVVAAVAAFARAREEVQLVEQEVLKPARESQALLQAAYAAGKVDLPSLLLLRNQLLDAELSYWDAWRAERQALVNLQAVTGLIGIEENAEPAGTR